MKAEQRKELETNILADKMGRAMKSVKTRPRRTFFIYVIIAAVVVTGVFLSYRWFATGREENSFRWVQFYDGSRYHLQFLTQKDGSTPAGKAARLQIAWIVYWDEGVKFIGHDPTTALNAMKRAGEFYRSLAEECKDDPVFEPQALLGQAVVEETVALQDSKNLKTAREYYEVVVAKYKDTAQGKFAQGRIDQLSETRIGEVESLYAELRRWLNVRPPAPLLKGGDQMPPLGPEP